MGTATKHPVPPFVIFDIRALLTLKMSYASKKYAGKTGPVQRICADKFLKQRKAINECVSGFLMANHHN